MRLDLAAHRTRTPKDDHRPGRTAPERHVRARPQLRLVPGVRGQESVLSKRSDGPGGVWPADHLVSGFVASRSSASVRSAVGARRPHRWQTPRPRRHAPDPALRRSGRALSDDRPDRWVGPGEARPTAPALTPLNKENSSPPSAKRDSAPTNSVPSIAADSCGALITSRSRISGNSRGGSTSSACASAPLHARSDASKRRSTSALNAPTSPT